MIPKIAERIICLREEVIFSSVIFETMLKICLYLLNICNGEFLKTYDVGIMLTDKAEDGIDALGCTAYSCITVMKGKSSYIPAQDLDHITIHRLDIYLFRAYLDISSDKEK